MERNVTLDFVRGVAILGILLLNVTAFGLPKAAYLNPAWAGSVSQADAWTWALLDLFAQVKFLTLFALLFGAGLYMLLSRGKRWIQARLTLLVLLGFFHSIVLWDGDILLAYGLVGIICWRLIRDAHSNRQLFNTGVVLYLMGIGVLILLGAISGTHTSRTWVPDAANIQYETWWKLTGGTVAMQSRLGLLSDNMMALAAQYGWQLAGMMLLGAALMRSGWLRGQFSLQHYRRTGFLLVGLGMLINIPAIIAQWYVGWSYHWCAFWLQIPRELSAPIQTIGYAALAWGFWPQLAPLKLVAAITCVGRMALTNYLLQTLICTTVFYHLGLYLTLTRFQLLGLVPVIWLINMGISVLWMRHFRQGPVEWLWRYLTARAAGKRMATSPQDLNHK